MNIKQILSRKGRDVLTIEPAATLADAVKLLAKGHIDALVFASVGGRIVGIFSLSATSSGRSIKRGRRCSTPRSPRL